MEVFETDKRDSSGQRIGTGMGLWIVNNTIQDYNGKIDLSKNITEKTGYFITLFLRRQEEWKMCRIGIIDDTDELLDDYIKRLKRENIELFSCAGRKQGGY